MHIQELLRYNGYVSLLDYILYLYNTENYCFTFIKCLRKEEINKFIVKFVELLYKKYKEEDFLSLIDLKTKCRKCYLFEWIEIINTLDLKYKYELYMLKKSIVDSAIDYLAHHYDAILIYISSGVKESNIVLTLSDYKLTTGSYMMSISRDNISYSKGRLTAELLHKEIS